MTASENEDNDILWCVNHDTFPFQKPMMETQVSSETWSKIRLWCCTQAFRRLVTLLFQLGMF